LYGLGSRKPHKTKSFRKHVCTKHTYVIENRDKILHRVDRQGYK